TKISGVRVMAYEAVEVAARNFHIRRANVRRAGLNLPCQQALPAAPNHRRQNLKTDQSKENPDRRRVGHAVSRRVGLEHAPRSHEQIEQSLQRAKVESERILDGVVQIIALLWFTHASPHLQAAY